MIQIAKTQFATYLWGVAAQTCDYLSDLFEGLKGYCWGDISFHAALHWHRDQKLRNKILEAYEGDIEKFEKLLDRVL